MLTKSLAMELSPYGIRVNCICPGGVNTPLVRPEGVSEDEFGQRVRTNVPIPRLSRPEEQAYAVLYLASDESSFVTGQALMTDGGEWAGTTDGLRR